ncbi:MAG: 4Fe-4S dicluster domain-containing protein [Elusimicrobia bacterium]|nr:4Fe-4S dicluster domain-containing protein [Elusimicrobiota bacterium]
MNEEETKKQNAEDAADGIKRRDFLQLMAGSFAALAAGGCRFQKPAEKVVPALVAPEEAAPGQAVWYATTCGACPAACGALAKVRDGRPIKLEGNPEHPVSRGGLCARGQASLLDLYDSQRYASPRLAGAPTDWDTADLEVIRALERARSSGKAVRLLSATWASPTARAEIARLRARFPTLRHVVYDEPSLLASVAAHRLTHGRAVLPTYHLDKAKAIVSFDADFLGTWGSPVQYTKDWAARRKPDAEPNLMSWHAQFEARMSPTGANADLRVPVKPSERYGTIVALGRLISQKISWSGPMPASGPTSVSRSTLLQTADALLSERRRAVVLCGGDDVASQAAANWINQMLGAYEQIADLSRPSRVAEGEIGAFDALLGEMRRGEVAVLIVRGCNPAQDHPRSEEFRKAAAKVGLFVSLAGRPNETCKLARIVCPEHHPLEAWADHDAHGGTISLSQPALSPLRDTRDALETLARWDGRRATAHESIRSYFRSSVFPRRKKTGSFESFWEDAVRAGAVAIDDGAGKGAFVPSAPSTLKAPRAPGAGFELVAYQSVALGDGRQANNPWLQELPDPVAKTTWGNFAAFSPADAKALGLVEGRVVKLSAGGVSVELPAQIQPGQASGTVAAALGYGRSGIGVMAGNFPVEKMLPIDFLPASGADVMPLSGAAAVTVSLLPRFERLAKTQTYDHLVDPLLGERRDHVRETVLADYLLNPRAGNPEEEKGKSLWKEHEYAGPKWGMAIDLNSCTGCSACVLSCNLENNVPVVGKSEVAKSRDMHWLRLDRYYSGPPDAVDGSPDVSFQPMLCQHCGNAPCETVCPVLATVHSTEGLNMQVYNRCVGTRYCANNCPFKTRRFNWFDYAHEDLNANLALNPDVTVRSRGVMEKCSFCVQRIYTAKADAKVEGRVLRDGDVKPACAQSCPAEAIVFGDLNDPKSKAAKLAKSERSYRVLAELGVQPSVHYLTKVRNKRV